MRTEGSQRIATPEEDGVRVLSVSSGGKGKGGLTTVSPEGTLQLWIRNDDYAGFVLEHYGTRYEFVRTVGAISQENLRECFSDWDEWAAAHKDS